MKKIFFINIVLILLFSCEKEDTIIDIGKSESVRVFFNHYFCDQGISFERIYYSEQEYQDDETCQISGSIPIDLGFDGIIAAIGIEVPYAGENAYSKSVELSENVTKKVLNINFILETKDTSKIAFNNDNVLIFLNGYDDSFEVNLSHEIIPLGG